MSKKILTSTSIGLLIILVVLMANFGVVFAARGQKSKTASLNYANIGMANLANIEGQPDVGFGFFDKMKKSTQGGADCLDIFGPDFMGIVTDSQTYKEFYDDVWFMIFPEAILVDDDDLEICAGRLTPHARQMSHWHLDDAKAPRAGAGQELGVNHRAVRD